MTTPASMIEWRIEAAWMAVIAEAVGSSVAVARWGDQSREDSYPCILVHCAGSSCPDNDLGFDYPVVSFVVFTRAYPDEDPTGEGLHTLVGTVRDLARDPDIAETLTAESDALNVFYVGPCSSEFPPISDDDRKIRHASITCEHKATCYDFPLPEEP